MSLGAVSISGRCHTARGQVVLATRLNGEFHHLSVFFLSQQVAELMSNSLREAGRTENPMATRRKWGQCARRPQSCLCTWP